MLQRDFAFLVYFAMLVACSSAGATSAAGPSDGQPNQSSGTGGKKPTGKGGASASEGGGGETGEGAGGDASAAGGAPSGGGMSQGAAGVSATGGMSQGAGGAPPSGGMTSSGGQPGTGGSGLASAFGGGGDPTGGGMGGTGVGGVDMACAAIEQVAKPVVKPADIIWAIDTSGSMSEETAFVRDRLNAFAGGILNLGIDVHVVMLGAINDPSDLPCVWWGICDGICIPQPLGSGMCPNDNNLPVYAHPAGSDVASTDGLLVIRDTYPTWKSSLRPDSVKTIIVVTDDDATSEPYGPANFPDGPVGSAAKFLQDFKALDPALLNDVHFSSIYSFTQCATAASVGSVWAELVKQSGGVAGDLCTQNFQPIFDSIATQIVIGSGYLDCQWAVPEVPAGQQFDKTKVNVEYLQGGANKTDVLYVGSKDKCDPTKPGWYYDNEADPKTILACPTTCDTLKADTAGKVNILFGCNRKEVEIK